MKAPASLHAWRCSVTIRISQSHQHVIHYVRQSKGKWLRSEVEGMDNEVALESLNVTLSLMEIYWRVKFEAE